MAKILVQKLKSAYEQAGAVMPGEKPKRAPKVAKPKASTGHAPAKPKANTSNRRGRRKPLTAEQVARRVSPAVPPPNMSAYGTPQEGNRTGPVNPVAPTSPRVTLLPGAVVTLTAPRVDQTILLEGHRASGRALQCCDKNILDEREVTIGLDFGTSSIKVVIGDQVLGKAFAVPFAQASGVSQYLLPSRLYETGSYLTVRPVSKSIHRDLKLAFIADPSNAQLQNRVIALLADVIGHSKGWLFNNHRNVYRRTRILWRLVIGLPVASHLQEPLVSIVSDLGRIAFALATYDGPISHETIREFRAGWRPVGFNNDAFDVEVSAVPELAAQIYGFVNSKGFNPSEPNNFLMVDVGAGSVDAALFHVEKATGGRWDFSIFTSTVEPHGVMNLHRARIDWWLDALSHANAPKNLKQNLSSVKFPTDWFSSIPKSFESYIAPVKIDRAHAQSFPDTRFFHDLVARQVRGKTYYRAWRGEYLNRQALAAIPTIYCGGGMRHPVYKQLENALRKTPGCTWLNAVPMRITVPRILDAKGLAASDYDRLSVAFGLSMLSVRSVKQALPIPMVNQEPTSSWVSNYVDKDHC